MERNLSRHRRADRCCDPGVLHCLHTDQHGNIRLHPKFKILSIHQLLLILILPWLVTLSLGGLKQSSVVIIWAALSILRVAWNRMDARDVSRSPATPTNWSRMRSTAKRWE